jgi:NADH-quinone oxidoreductase subunit G
LRPSRLDADAHAHLRLLPGDEAVVISAITEMISATPGDTPNPAVSPFTDFIHQVAATLKADDTNSLTVLVGMELLRAPHAALALRWLERLLRCEQQSGKRVTLQFMFDRCNQLGAWEMGVLPSHLAGWQKNGQAAFEQAWDMQLAPDPGADAHALLQLSAAGAIDCLYLLGSDPLSTYPDRTLVENALSSVGLVVVQASHHSATTQVADIILPAAAFGEETGTVTNNEGRIQLAGKIRAPVGEAHRNADILRQVTETFGYKLCGPKLEDTFSEIARLVPSFTGLSLADIGEDGAFSARPGHIKSDLPGDLPLPSGVDRAWENDGKLMLVTGECRFHAGYVSEHSATLSAITAQAYVEIADSVCKKLGLKPGEMTRVRSPHGEMTLKVKTNKQFPPELAFIPENFASQHLNQLFKQGEFSCPVEILSNET